MATSTKKKAKAAETKAKSTDKKAKATKSKAKAAEKAAEAAPSLHEQLVTAAAAAEARAEAKEAELADRLASTDRWSVTPQESLRVGAGFTLAEFDPRGRPGWEGGKSQGRERMAVLGEEMSELQERLFAQGRVGGSDSVLLVLQGLDTSGKGGIVRHVLGMVDPQGVALRSFGVPTAEEKKHHYLWRIRRALPPPGRIGVFDRSHYEDVLAVRVLGLVPREQWERRYAELNRFEQQTAARGIRIVKVLLTISPDEQADRLRSRLERPDKRWKYSTSDVDTRKLWPDYAEAFQAMLDRTSTDLAPWHVVPADRKWFARLAVSELVTQALRDLELGWPTPSYDVVSELERLERTRG